MTRKKKRSESNVPAGPSSKSRRKTSPEMKATAGEAMSAGPSTEIPRNFDDEAMAIDSPLVASREVPAEALSSFIDFLAKGLRLWQDDGTDTSINSILQSVFIGLVVLKSEVGCPAGFLVYEGHVSEEKFLNNVKVAKARDPAFVKSLGEAIRRQNKELWGRVLMHDVFYTTMPDEPDKPLAAHDAHSELQEQAIIHSWLAPFVGRDALDALVKHVDRERNKKGAYAPFCSIIQSSGMGKSRLLDELSKTYFLIPINLRRSGSTGYPPPDVSVRDLLTASNSARDAHICSLWFLLTLFARTTRIITEDLKDARKRSTRTRKFREFMTDGQTKHSVGENRRKFYQEIVDEVENKIRSTEEVTAAKVKCALDALLSCLGDDPKTDKHPGVFIAFDEAQSLAQPIESKSRRTFFIEVRRALQALLDTSSFVFFLSTTSKISQFAMPGEIDESARKHDKHLRTPLPFSDLGFDHLMQNRKILDKFKTINEAASTECVVHMGRPMWGTMYDSSEAVNRETILSFAITKLLCAPDDESGSLSLTTDQQCSILSQRLALDINSTAYVTSGSTRNYDMADKAQLQISNFMRVCIAIPEDLVAVRGVAASEPILSEAASRIMRGRYNFDLPDALLNILDSYSIDHGDRGELLVAAFFMRARDLRVKDMSEATLFPQKMEELCPIFSVNDLLSHLFQEAHFSTMSNSFPSVSRAGFPPQKFGDIFDRTKMHFNHMIKPYRQAVLTRQSLLAMMARGAAAFGANGQQGFDMVFPFLYDTNILDVQKVGFVLVQVKNFADSKPSSDHLLRMMDPFHCSLLDEDEDLDFTVRIVRIVFSLGDKKPDLRCQTYTSPKRGATTFDKDGQPKFTSYDFWCSGIGPKLLRPVDENNSQKKWQTLLGKLSKWDGLFPKALGVRRSQYPAGGTDVGHYQAWFSTNG